MENGRVDVFVVAEMGVHEHVLCSEGGGVRYLRLGGLLSRVFSGVWGDEEALGVGDGDFARDGGSLLLGKNVVKTLLQPLPSVNKAVFADE